MERSFANDAPTSAAVPSSTGLAVLPGDTTKRAWPPKLPDYPLSHRYDPLPDIGSDQFRKSHTTFHRPGVTHALID